MASSRQFLKMGPQVPDSKGAEGEFTWIHTGIVPVATGYIEVPAPTDQVEIVSSISGNVRALYNWKTNHVAHRLFLATGTDIYEEGVGNVHTGMDSGTIYGPQFAAFGPQLYVTNGMNTTAADKIHFMDPTTAGVFAPITLPVDSTGATAADIRPKFLIAFKNQLIAANIVVNTGFAPTTTQGIAAGTYRHLVWWSCPDNVHAFGSQLGTPMFFNTGYQPIFDDSIEITGLCAGEDAFFVFKEHGIYRFNGPPLGGYDTISNSWGCVAPNSIQRLGDEILFLSQQGLCSLNIRTNEISPLSKGINANVMCEGVYEGNATSGFYTPFWDDGNMGYAIADDYLGIDSTVEPNYGLYLLMFKKRDSFNHMVLIYNTWTKEFGLFKAPLNNPSSGAVFTNVPLAPDATRFPLSTIWFSMNKYKKGFLSTGLGDPNLVGGTGGSLYIRWPFLFSYPDKRTSIRAIRPIVNSTAGPDPTLYQIEARIYSLNGSFNNFDHAVVTESSGLGNDFNIVFEKCPFADSHSIGINLSLATGSLISTHMFNILGIEVEYEEDSLIGK